MEKELDKLDSYLQEHYIDIEDSVYLFFKWILENREYIVPLPSLTLLYKNHFIAVDILKEGNICYVKT